MPCFASAGIIAFMRRLAPLFLLAACAGPVASADGRWFGTMTPVQASSGCVAGRASLVSSRGAVLFTPDEGTRTLEGTVSPEGAVTAERTTPGANKQPYTTTLTAQLAPGAITGTYATPRCRYAVALTRP